MSSTYEASGPEVPSQTHRYDDMINLPRPVSKKHPPMPPEKRAAQFMPFAALTGFDDEIAETARLTDPQRDLAEDERQRINRTLKELESGEIDAAAVEITYFEPDERKAGGAYRTVRGAVRRIDHDRKRLLMEDGTVIPVERILEIRDGG